MEKGYVLGIDIGGSHIACQLVDPEDCTTDGDTYTEVKVSEKEAAGVILAAWEKALTLCMEKAGKRKVTGLGVAVPSPFDFVQGIAMADHKFASLKGLNIREELRRVTGIAGERILFTNDAAAFGMGAWKLDGGKDRHLIGVTLGTGFGACFIVDGCYAVYGPGVPVGGELWNFPYRNVIAEDYISTRWFEKRFRELTGEPVKGLKGMVERYETGEHKVVIEQVFGEFATSFVEVMLPFMKRFKADKLVIGGGMVLSGQYFMPGIRQHFRTAGVDVPVTVLSDTTRAIMVGASTLCD